MKVVVLRLGHRIERDKRITTHVCLSARALGANEAILSDERDSSILESVEDIAQRWGGDFKVSYEKNWRSVLKAKKAEGYEIIHLTMYGLRVQDEIKKIRESGKDKLIVVGGEKVPGEVYQIADYNISVSGQPHSEVAALAITLHELFSGKELEKEFNNPKIKLVPSKAGKTIINQV